MSLSTLSTLVSIFVDIFVLVVQTHQQGSLERTMDDVEQVCVGTDPASGRQGETMLKSAETVK